MTDWNSDAVLKRDFFDFLWHNFENFFITLKLYSNDFCSLLTNTTETANFAVGERPKCKRPNH